MWILHLSQFTFYKYLQTITIMRGPGEGADERSIKGEIAKRIFAMPRARQLP
jgi:hypothetical protein